MPLAQRDSLLRAALVEVLQPGSARYGGCCNPDATAPKVSQPGGVRDGHKVLRPGRLGAVACNALDGPDECGACNSGGCHVG